MSRITAILTVLVGVPVVYLTVRAVQSSSSDAESGTMAEAERQMLESRTLRAERQSVQFADRIDELEAEIDRLRSAAQDARSAGAVEAARAAQAVEAARLAGKEVERISEAAERLEAIESGVNGAIRLLQEVHREQGELRRESQESEEKVASMLTELGSGTADTGSGGLAAKIAALETSTAQALASLDGAMAELSKKLDAATTAATGAGVGNDVSQLASELALMRQKIEASFEKLDALQGSFEAQVTGSARVPAHASDSSKPSVGLGHVFRGDKTSPDAERASAVPSRRPVAAELRAVDEARSIVILDKGEQHGVRQGDEFLVTRLGREVGRVKVIRLWPDYCGATVVETVQGEKLVRGDVARNYPPTGPGKAGGGESGAGSTDTDKVGIGAIGGRAEERAPPPPPVVEN